MPYAATILADSIASGVRLVTMQVTYPRMIHSELMTHRVFSRNAASSRAIPIEKMIAGVVKDPVIPVWWGKNQKGMQAEEELHGAAKEQAQVLWLQARDAAVQSAQSMFAAGLHKQLVNRVIEPWMWITVIITATEWDNFFALRCNSKAQPEIRTIAEMMKAVMESSTPKPLKTGEWHLPYIDDEDREAFDDHDPAALPSSYLPRVSCARCARVSYLTQDGKRDINADLDLHDRLIKPGHMSPFEHAAMVGNDQDVIEATDGLVAGDGDGCAGDPRQFIGNFRAPWIQYRKGLPNEAVFRAAE